MSLILNFVHCFTGLIGIIRGLILHVCDFVSMYFKIMSKVVKYTCRLRRSIYTHNQLNTRYHFLEFFLRGGGAQNLSLPPGASYPRYATAIVISKFY